VWPRFTPPDVTTLRAGFADDPATLGATPARRTGLLSEFGGTADATMRLGHLLRICRRAMSLMPVHSAWKPSTSLGASPGGVAERLNAAALKAARRACPPRGFESLPLRTPDGLFETSACSWSSGPFSMGGRLGTVEAMAEFRSVHRVQDVQGEQVRRLRLQADGQRSLAVNLRETIALTRKLFELRHAAQRTR
jgi:hypothetical protein